jgi:hypothetical protein
MAQASELSQMHVADLRGSQLSRQGLPVEVRVVSRAGDTAYVYDALDAVRSEKIEEVFPCAIRMSNRQDNGLFDFDPSHDDYPFPTDPWQAHEANQLQQLQFTAAPICRIEDSEDRYLLSLNRHNLAHREEEIPGAQDGWHRRLQQF